MAFAVSCSAAATAAVCKRAARPATARPAQRHRRLVALVASSSSAAAAAAEVAAPIGVLRQACRTKKVDPDDVVAAMQAVEAAHQRQPLVEDFPANLSGTWRLVFSAPSPIKQWQYIPVLEDAIIDVDAGTVALASVVGPLDNVFKGRCSFTCDPAAGRYDMDFGFSAAQAKWFGRWETQSEFKEKRRTYSFFLLTDDLAVANSSGGPKTLMYRIK